MRSTATTRRSIIRTAAVATVAFALAAGPATAASAKSDSARPDTACQKAGMSTLRSLGLLDDVARGGLPIALAVEYGVAPRATTDVASLPDPLPLSVVLADHRAGSASLFMYPWCS